MKDLAIFNRGDVVVWPLVYISTMSMSPKPRSEQCAAYRRIVCATANLRYADSRVFIQVRVMCLWVHAHRTQLITPQSPPRSRGFAAPEHTARQQDAVRPDRQNGGQTKPGLARLVAFAGDIQTCDATSDLMCDMCVLRWCLWKYEDADSSTK